MFIYWCGAAGVPRFVFPFSTTPFRPPTRSSAPLPSCQPYIWMRCVEPPGSARLISPSDGYRVSPFKASPIHYGTPTVSCGASMQESGVSVRTCSPPAGMSRASGRPGVWGELVFWLRCCDRGRKTVSGSRKPTEGGCGEAELRETDGGRRSSEIKEDSLRVKLV